MLDTLNSLLAFTVLVLAAYGLGMPLARGLRADGDDLLEAVVWRLSLGLLAAAGLLTVLGLMGGLYAWAIRLLTVVGAGYGVYELRYVGNALRGVPRRVVGTQFPERHGGRFLQVTAVACAGLASAAALVAATAPPTAGDALCYHLELPKTYLAEHALVALPDSDNGTYPLFAEMWFLWGLALEGGVTAQLVHWGLGVLLGLGTVVLATPVLSRPWACAAGAVVLLLPGVSNQMTAPLNDVALAAFATLALAAWRRALAEPARTHWFVIAGLMGGAALGIKYVALLYAAAVGLTWIWKLLTLPLYSGGVGGGSEDGASKAEPTSVPPEYRGEVWRLLRGGAIACVVALSVAFVWYVRAAWQRGNPVYPFFSAYIGQAGPETADKTPLGWRPTDVLAAPFAMTFSPERFGGSGHQLGPLLLMALPGLIAARRLRGLGSLLAVAGLYAVLWYALRQNVRFLYPILPPLAVAAVWVAMEMRLWPALPRLLAGGALAGAVLLGVAAPLKRSRDKAAVACGWESREEYLLRSEPTYVAAAAANAALRPGDRLLSQDYRAFYFNGRVTRESIYRRRTAYDRSIASDDDVAARLREAGFTHLLLAENEGPSGAAFDPTLSRLVERSSVVAPSSFDTLADYRVAADDGGLRRYRLLRIR